MLSIEWLTFAGVLVGLIVGLAGAGGGAFVSFPLTAQI